MSGTFRLAIGSIGPTQQSSVSCGAACLTVARMMRDPRVAQWVVEGPPGDVRTPTERFAHLERRTMRRTNAAFAAGHARLPWPRALGTSPWGAVTELETRGADPGAPYRLRVVRQLGRDGLARAYEEDVAGVRPGRPTLLYVGDDVLPRHVCLVFADPRDRQVLVYEPGAGAVDAPSRERFVSARLGLGGWQRAWFVIAASARLVGAPRPGRLLAPVPLKSPGAAVLLREPGDAR